LSTASIFQDLSSALAPWGLITRGGLHSEDEVSAIPQTFILIGNFGSRMWERFSAEKIARLDPLDHWTQQVIEPIAAQVNAKALYAFEGPPYHPFQSWAMQAEAVFPSPIGPLIHPEFGLWHAYRAALVFDQKVELPVQAPATSPCETCTDKPCLTTCPVGAFSSGTYDVPACVEYLETPAGKSCLTESCAARRACPVGTQYHYSEGQSDHHMNAFFASVKNTRRTLPKLKF
jgi:hypothetical protein